ncbi:MAG: LysR family transcriptional regulator [Acetobacteraceae bacterium]
MRHVRAPAATRPVYTLLRWWAETGSLSGAATRLNVTQPAVSKRIRLLEAHLHTALVSRGANALNLTPAGRRYADAVSNALSGICTATAALER